MNKGWLDLGEDLLVAGLRNAVFCPLIPGLQMLVSTLGVRSHEFDQIGPLCFVGASLIDEPRDVSLAPCTSRSACINNG